MPRHNLPARLTSFVGREHEIVEVRALLRARRLVTLAGRPGVGKTQLGLQVAGEMRDGFPGGVWLIELAPLADPALAPHVVADTLGVREQPGQLLTAALVNWLQPHRVLLLLDNCEHLIGAVAALAEALLQACPDLYVLATSREPLAIEGKAPYRVPSLSVRGSATDSAPGGSEAIRLFVNRVQTADPSFELNARNAAAVAQICTRLDGTPAGDRACCGSEAYALAGADRRAARRPLPLADRRLADGAPTSADAAWCGRLELRPADGAGTSPPAEPRRVRRRLHAGGCRSGFAPAMSWHRMTSWT